MSKSSEKILFILEKPKARQYIKVIVDPEDKTEWFILFQWIEIKTDTIKHQSMIIRKDLSLWIQSLTESRNWKIKINNLK